MQTRFISSLLVVLMPLALAGCGATTPRPSTADTLLEELAVYFNDPLAGLPQMASGTVQANGIDQALLDLIDSARVSLDAAIYHMTMPAIIEALGRACDRGVNVRLIVEAAASRPTRLPACLQLRLDQNARSMHHKFLIVDQRVVWTGSTNWTEASLYSDANNSVVLHSQSVAGAFEAEFEEMYSHHRYGQAKRDTSEERFTVRGVAVEVYFSPSDRPRQRLIELIRDAQQTIQLALYAFTDRALAEELLAAQRRGVHVQALWDFLSAAACHFSKVDELRKEGIGLFEANPGLLHHKYVLIDERIVITGSANWSISGMEHNDENILILHDEGIARQYGDHFARLVRDAHAYERDAHQPPRIELRHFDVARGAALLQWRPHALGVVDHYEICRVSGPHGPTCTRLYEIPGWAWYFVDRDVTPGRQYSYRARTVTSARASEYSYIYQTYVRDDIPLLTPEEAVQSLPLYEGRIVTVRFPVANRPAPTGREGHIYLNAGEDYRSDFTAFIPACALERFTGSGLDLFDLKGRILEVTGELSEYNGPEIIVVGPWQIRVVE
jgi:phosphatidylserine/phosphatidylglycerophosphate/cardiolipin synthase-like enzyme